MKLASHKIKAGALQFSILISVVIAVIVSAFILLTHTQLKFAKKIELSGHTIQLANEGIKYARNYNIPYNDSITIDFEANGLEEFVSIEKSHWGIYDKVLRV
jgi:hypothetical protein